MESLPQNSLTAKNEENVEENPLQKGENGKEICVHILCCYL
jgi:hypothetical protein